MPNDFDKKKKNNGEQRKDKNAPARNNIPPANLGKSKKTLDFLFEEDDEEIDLFSAGNKVDIVNNKPPEVKFEINPQTVSRQKKKPEPPKQPEEKEPPKQPEEKEPPKQPEVQEPKEVKKEPASQPASQPQRKRSPYSDEFFEFFENEEPDANKTDDDQEEIDEDINDDELSERDEMIYRMAYAMNKDMAPRKREPNPVSNEARLGEPVKFEIKKGVDIFNEIAADDSDEIKKDEKANLSPAEEDANRTMFFNKLNTFNGMYRTQIDADKFVSSVSDAWTLLSSSEQTKATQGRKMLKDLFNDTLKQAFEVEKSVAFEEQRFPEYGEIVKSANDLMRVSMFAYTDMYSNQKRSHFFEATAYGGLDAKEMAQLTKDPGIWKLDQRSDEAWQIQSKAAKEIAENWLKEDKPYEKMINDLKNMIESNGGKYVEAKGVYDKLAAAEWLLLNNDKMMMDNPEDPLNKMPNWGTRYWKAIVQAREACGIPKYVSMRELIQGNYAEMKKAVTNVKFQENQISEQVMNPAQRAVSDSMEKQLEEFAVQREGIATSQLKNEKAVKDIKMDSDRVPIVIEECDEQKIMKEAPKNNNFIPKPEKSKQLPDKDKPQINNGGR